MQEMAKNVAEDLVEKQNEVAELNRDIPEAKQAVQTAQQLVAGKTKQREAHRAKQQENQSAILKTADRMHELNKELERNRTNRDQLKTQIKEQVLVRSCPVLSCPVLSCPVLSCPLLKVDLVAFAAAAAAAGSVTVK
jgi:hypothetical protein